MCYILSNYQFVEHKEELQTYLPYDTNEPEIWIEIFVEIIHWSIATIYKQDVNNRWCLYLIKKIGLIQSHKSYANLSNNLIRSCTRICGVIYIYIISRPQVQLSLSGLWSQDYEPRLPPILLGKLSPVVL